MLLQTIKNLFKDAPIYIKLRPQLLSIRDLSSKKTIEEVPVLALSKDKKKVLALGTRAISALTIPAAQYTLENGFEHPRTILANFDVAETTLQYMFQSLVEKTLLKASPIFVLHVLEKNEGGLSSIEVRALQELARGVGAREVYIWTGRELLDSDFETQTFPGDYWLPNTPKWAKLISN